MPENTPIRTMLDDRPVWRWPDGTTVPVVSGADDDLGDPSAAFAAALDDDGDPGEGAPVASADDPEPTGDPEPRMVPWDDHVKLRSENADYRKRFQPYEKAFGALDPEAANAFLELASVYAKDPAAATAALAEAFGFDLDGEAGGGQPQFLTREDFRAEMEAFHRQQQQQAQETQAIEAGRDEIRKVAKDCGFEPGTKDYKRLLAIAQSEFATDDFGDQRSPTEAVRLAAESLTGELAEFQRRVVSEYLEGKAKGGGVATTGSAGEAPSTEEPITNLETASRAFKEFLTSA